MTLNWLECKLILLLEACKLTTSRHGLRSSQVSFKAILNQGKLKANKPSLLIDFALIHIKSC